MDWTAVGAISGCSVAAIAIITFIGHQLKPKFLAIRQFRDHLVGVEANTVTGQERVPGLFEVLRELTAQSGRVEERLEERLDQQDGVLAAQDQVLETIRHEVEFNNGSSVKDAIVRTEKQGKELAIKLDAHLAACPGTPQTTINVNPGGTP